MKKPVIIILLICSSLLAYTQKAATVFGEVLIKLQTEVGPEEFEKSIQEQIGILPEFKYVSCVSEYMHIHLFSFDENEMAKEELLRMINAQPDVVVAQANHIISERVVPDDPFFGQQWHHVQSEDHDIDTDLAWDITTGGYTATGDEIVICNVEPNGATWAQADIAPNHWINENEIADNNLDDDNNGYVDDVDGWNSAADNDDISGGNHGTQTSSMMGAKGNNTTGIAGVNWDVKIMQVQMGGVNENNVIAAYEYPLTMRRLYNQTNGVEGAFVVAVNSSWGTDNGQPEDAPLWCAMYDSLGAQGVLSCGATANNNVNIDLVGDLPTGCPSEYMIAVTATNNEDVRTFSGYGQTLIDLGAPGEDVYLAGNSSYGTTSGTSFASPCVAGAVALAYSTPCTSFMEIVNADAATGAQIIRDAIFDGTDAVANLGDECVTGGRLNVNNTINLLLNNCESGTCVAPFAVQAIQETGTTNYTISWLATNSANSFTLQYRPVDSGPWTEATSLLNNSYFLNDLLSCTPYEVQLMTTCDESESQWTESFIFTTDGCCINPAQYQTISVTATAATISWSDVLAAENYTITFGPDGGPVITVNDVTETNYTFEELEACTNYTISVFSSCVGPEPVPTSYTFNTPGCGDCEDLGYCEVTADADLEYIENVTLGDINNTSADDGGYILVAGQTTILNAGSQYTIYCTPGYAGFSYNEYFKAWIDYDADGEFEEPTELVFDAGGGTTSEVSGSFTVPISVQDGIVRMRVGMSYYGSFGSGEIPVACGANEYGETEDYCVVLDDDVTVSEMESGSFSVYPNPFSGEVFFYNPQLNGNNMLHIKCTDNAGRTVYQGQCTNGNQTDMSQLCSGLYLVEITAENIHAHCVLVKK
ncbi:MAG: S8 family serine peptidase [Flavobacteriales bacterium]